MFTKKLITLKISQILRIRIGVHYVSMQISVDLRADLLYVVVRQQSNILKYVLNQLSSLVDYPTIISFCVCKHFQVGG